MFYVAIGIFFGLVLTVLGSFVVLSVLEARRQQGR